MRICSVTLAGPGTEGIIGDALRSVVDAVDACVVMYTGEPGEAYTTFRAAIDTRSDRVIHWFAYAWVDDFALMRNEALRHAERVDCDWALWLDTDERITFAPGWREALNTSACAVNAWHVSGEYAKERFIRLPRQGSYIGPTHEYFEPKKGRTIVDTRLVTFDELPRDKDGPAWAAKLRRDRDALKAHLAQTFVENRARWNYYLGDTHALLGETQQAHAAWKTATESDGPVETVGWAAFRWAVSELRELQPMRALHAAMTGIELYPHAPELFWAAAAASFDLDEYEKAICFAMHAGVAGSYNGWGRGTNRSAFIYPPAHFEGPLDVMSLAYDKLGRPDMALAVRQEYMKAKEAREAQ
jgi:tetratricopeptide (TPR) repeat protein